jgi:hypothetical protein
MKSIIRAVLVLLATAVAVVGLSGTASAATKPTPAQVAYAKCVASETVKLLKEVERKVWKDRKARQAAVENAYRQAKSTCTPATPPTTYVKNSNVAIGGGASGTHEVSCDAGDRAVDHQASADPAGQGASIDSQLTDTGVVVRYGNTNEEQGYTLTVRLTCQRA